MKLNNIVLAAVFAFSVFGCSDEEEPPGTTGEMCSQLDVECTGDTICGETDCEDAFPREYRARLNVHSLTPDRKCELHADCPRLPVMVYQDDLAHPILDNRKPGIAHIDLVAGSSLIIAIDDEACTVPMTAALMRSGPAWCSGDGLTASVSLFPMPLDGDAVEER